MIELKDITVSKRGRKWFENFSLKIQPGENWIVHGHNGSGKTMLLQLITGSLHPLSGHIHYSFMEGEDWESLYHQRQQKIHLIPTHSLQTFLHGYGGLFYQQRYYSMDDTQLPKVQDVFGEDIQKLKNFDFPVSFNVKKLLDLELTRLSNGQLKKVLIMRHLIKNVPDFLLLDYPFDGLDLESRNDLSAFIDDIARKFSIQIIMVDHDHALPSVINRKLVLHHFKIKSIEDVKGDVTTAIPFDKEGAENKMAEWNDSPPVVEMKDLTIQYSGKKIIENLNWRIRQGERWALTGKNGSGKTTLFSLIYADHPMAYSQKVFLFGKRRGSGESIWDIKKRINYLGPEQIHFLNPKGMAINHCTTPVQNAIRCLCHV
jgi:molybdate transport system ATP-binding protein